jgi:hypothetical protein
VSLCELFEATFSTKNEGATDFNPCWPQPRRPGERSTTRPSRDEQRGHVSPLCHNAAELRFPGLPSFGPSSRARCAPATGTRSVFGTDRLPPCIRASTSRRCGHKPRSKSDTYSGFQPSALNAAAWTVRLISSTSFSFSNP